MPVALAPTGLTGFFHRDGEIEAARAAQAAGVPFTLSTMSICSIEDVRAAVEGTFWFQLYLMRDRGFNEALIARAREARCSALMLTLDLPLQALRRRDPKNGLSVPPRITAANAWEILLRPRWLTGVLLGGGARSAISRPSSRNAASASFPNGWADSSILRSPGRTSPGCASAGRASSSSREYSTPRMRGWPPTPAPMPSSFRIMAAGNSMGPPRRSRHCRAWSTPSPGVAKC